MYMYTYELHENFTLRLVTWRTIAMVQVTRLI